MIGYIYITTNIINNKKYIGRRKSDVFLGNNYLGSGVHLKRAIQKYGFQNFKVDLLEEVNGTYEDLIERETYYIKLYDAVNNEMFYNHSYGGKEEGFVKGNQNIACSERARKLNSDWHKFPCTEERRKSMSNYWKTHEHPKGFKGHHHSKDAIEKISEASKKYKHTDERKLKISHHHIGSKMMHKNDVQRWVYKEEIQKFLDDGWLIGACKKRAPRKYKNKN